MIIPVFRPTDEELLIHYLERKCKHLSLPCNVVFESQIYRVGDKRHGRFSPEMTRGQNVPSMFSQDDEGGVIGSKRTLCFRINNESGVIDEEGERKGHWIMHEYSLGDGKSPAGKGECLLCRIRRLDKDPKKSVMKAKNVEAGSVDDNVAVQKPAKRARTELVPEQRTDCDIAAEPETEVVLISEDLFVQEPGFMMSGDPNDLMFDLEEFKALLEGEKQGSYRHCDSAAPVRSDHIAVISNTKEQQEQQQGFLLARDAFGNISSTNQVVPSGLASESFVDDWMQYVSPELIGCVAENFSNTEILLSAELLPRYQESNRWYQESNRLLPPNFRFDATIEPSPICSVSNNMHVQLDPETISALKNMPWPNNCFPDMGMGVR
ncbi:hypothetical protein RHGRI_028725 [Rhododendron griersonianum]|uniref:NAC domain-containing protein n=1 Tax=Rhododendron griersonianum TaxID=479676 RepID=A0AAV6IIU5_9ERIC|nr:hypothetical protein RHGRI_028725 [Rhododendron griersonianum]